MGEYCNYHIAQGIADHSKIGYKGQVLVEPFNQNGAVPPVLCNGIQTNKKQCQAPAVWQTTCYLAKDRIEWIGKPIQ